MQRVAQILLWNMALLHTRARPLWPGCSFLTLSWSQPDTEIAETRSEPGSSNEVWERPGEEVTLLPEMACGPDVYPN